MSIIKYKEIFEALGNDKRIKLYELINKEIFISKSRLAEELNLNRANLNHHLEKLKNAGLIMEKSLFINRRKQTFIVPRDKIHMDHFLSKTKHNERLGNLLDIWTTRNLTVDTFQRFKKDLIEDDILFETIDKIEIVLFPNMGKVESRGANFCIICHQTDVNQFCRVCQNAVCKEHIHKITRVNNEIINLCESCLERYFG